MADYLNIRLNYVLRTLPLVFYGLLVFYSSIFSSFDYWTTMIDIKANFFNWILAGIFNVIFVLFLLYVRLMIIRFSFQDLNEKIPHTDHWELIQFYVTIGFTILVVVNGLLLTVMLITSTNFQDIQKLLIIVPFLIDLLFHLKWILL